MKIALINDQLNAGGAEKVLVNMANLMHGKGIEVVVVLYLKPAILDRLLHSSIPVFYLERKGRFDISAMRALKKIVHTTDIVHVHSRYNLRYLMVAKLLTGISKPKIVFHEHVPVLFVDRITRLCLKKADAYIAVLKTMSEWAAKELGLSPAKVFYLPNTVNAPGSKIASAPAGRKILMVGNFWYFKNQFFAIDLIKALPAGFSLDMYGTINDKEYHKALLSLISAYQLESRIRLIEGVSNIYSVIGNYNFAIHTSPHETGPLVLIEYMHASLPFITFKTGDVVANIYNELPEAVIDSFEVNDWKKRIEEVMMNEDARSQMKYKMKTLVEKYYTEESYWQKLHSIYQSILN